tara:strand:+ start:333 stop:1070 length:738 start_codon:yes stop_codon:yes gene_type:complete
VLLILATYANNKTGVVYVDEASLAEDCEMPRRTLQRYIAGLRDQGFLIRERRANQFQGSMYRLPLEQDPKSIGEQPPPQALAQERASATLPPPTAVATVEHPPSIRQASATDGGSNSKEGEERGAEGFKKDKIETPLSISLSPESTPDWLMEARQTEGWKTRGAPHEASLIAWVGRKGITDDDMEMSAIALGKVQAKTLRGYTNLARALQDRVNKGFDRNGAGPETRTQAEILEEDRLKYEGRKR